ncbi:hypothetical protein [Streptomyces griseorubiginosus]|uniref:hypothetical protein n=1 Tax=Streptomyces griseorubiginosus TaxID=67304 RepID=UPI00076BFB8D|nr:hypothetical protein [Streptomyces griseorubiginosus]KUM69257.1 hypothetical protein AQI84_34590 [Streptomyces griseorubiginosus]
MIDVLPTTSLTEADIAKITEDYVCGSCGSTDAQRMASVPLIVVEHDVSCPVLRGAVSARSSWLAAVTA